MVFFIFSNKFHIKSTFFIKFWCLKAISCQIYIFKTFITIIFLNCF